MMELNCSPTTNFNMEVNWKTGSAEIEFKNRDERDTFTSRLLPDQIISAASFYVLKEGKLLWDLKDITDYPCKLQLVPRILGGKGGFGSMLRAIGAQIEKTTNRDACRDLSGRRLRDINEEQVLKRWFAKQGEREEKKKEAKKRKLEKLQQVASGNTVTICQDVEYNKLRSEMSENVFDAVDRGIRAQKEIASNVRQASESEANLSDSTDNNDYSKPSSSSSNRTEENSTFQSEKSKNLKKTFFDEELDSDVSSSDDEEVPEKRQKLST